MNSQEAIDYLAFDAYGKYNSHLNQLCLNENIIYRSIYDNNLVDLILSIPIKYRHSGKLLKLIIKDLDEKSAAIPLADSGKPLKNNQFTHWLFNYLNTGKKY